MNEGLDFAHDRALRMMRIGAHDAAIDAWRDVLTQDPSLAEAHSGLARSLFHRRRLVAARVEAERALEIDATRADPLLVLALCDIFESRRKRAFKRLDEALALEPLNAGAHELRAQFLRDAGRWDEAEAAIKKALELQPFDTAARIEEARLAQVRGDDARAAALATDLIAQDPQCVAALVVLGKVRRRHGDVEEAYALAMSALLIDASDPEALDLLASVKMSRNPIGGVFWHVTRWLQQVGEARLGWLLWFIYLGYLLTLTTMRVLGVPDYAKDIFVMVYVLFWIGLWANRSLIDRMVQKELAAFRFSSSF